MVAQPPTLRTRSSPPTSPPLIRLLSHTPQPLLHSCSRLVRRFVVCRSLLSVCALFLLCLSLPPPSLAVPSPTSLPFPTVPSSYDSHVSLFFPLSSFSLSYRDYYSASSSTLRRDHHFTRADVSEFLSYQPHEEAVTLVNTTTGRCTVYTLSPEQSAHLYYRPSSSILQLLTAVQVGWQYEGATLAVRNVSAHQWRLSNVTITSSGVLCVDSNTTSASGEQCIEPSDALPSFSQLIDQTTDLSTDDHYSYSDVSIDYYVQSQPVSGLDGSAPLRVVVSGYRSDRPSQRFTHYFDWLQFKPLDSADLYVDTSSCSLGGMYAPALPQSIPPSESGHSSHHHHHLSALPKLPTSFTMLVEAQTSLYDQRTDQHYRSTSGSMLWTRLSDALESTQYLNTSTTLARDNSTALSSTTLYYNYSSSPPLVWSVNSTNCSVQRVTWNNLNPLASPIPVSFLNLFKSNWWPDKHPMSMSYSFVGWQEVHGVQCMHYQALKQEKLADPINFWLYNSSIYLAPPSWQHPDQSSYQLPIQFINTGSDFYYPDKKNNTSDSDRDKDKDREKEKKKEAERDSKDEEEDTAGALAKCLHALSSLRSSSLSDCLTALLSDPAVPKIKAPCPPHSELPSQRSFSEVWHIHGLYAPVSPQSFDIERLGCPIALTPLFPPWPGGYSSSTVVSSTLTTQVYAYTEYVHFHFGQRVDGRFHGRDSIEVTHPSGLSVLYDNPLQDEAAYGYGSREDYSTHPILASYIPTLDGRGQTKCKRQGKFDFPQMSQQFIAPIYSYYLAQYPPLTWVHAEPATLNGMLVDQWQAINQTTTVDGDLIFDTAIFYFSHPDTIYDGQVPLRFEISKVMIATSSDESQTVLESTVVDFLQWSALECSFNCYMTLFSLPPVHDCPVDTYETRYETLFSALTAPAQPAEYTALPNIPQSFTAVILTQLNESSSQLYALRWYVDNENDRERLDWAPVNSHAQLYRSDHHSVIYNHEDDWGAYRLNRTGCTSLNMSSHHAINPLLLHHSGSLLDFFDDSFDDATVLQADKVDGVDVVCFQKRYQGVYNRYTNRTYSFIRQACFAQQNWVLYPSAQQQQLTSIEDTGTYTYWSSEAQSLQSAEFVADYDVLFVEAEVPAAALFNLTAYQCAASGITYVDPGDDDCGGGASPLGVLTSPEALGLAVLAGVVATALVYSLQRTWQRRHQRSLDEWIVVQEPLHSLSTSESCSGMSSSPRNGALSDAARYDSELEDVRDVVKPALIL